MHFSLRNIAYSLQGLSTWGRQLLFQPLPQYHGQTIIWGSGFLLSNIPKGLGIAPPILLQHDEIANIWQ